MAFLGGVIGNEQRIPSQVIRWLCLLRNMLLVSTFRHLGRDNVAKRSTQRWRSLMVLLETSNIFLLKLNSDCACSGTCCSFLRFGILGNKDIAKRSTQRWRSLVVSLKTSNLFLPELIQWLCLFKKYWERGCNLLGNIL